MAQTNSTASPLAPADRTTRIPSAATLRANGEREYERAIVRRAELLASDPTIHRHGDVEPERDYYSISLHREDCGGGYVAHLTTWDLEQRFRVTYGRHDPDSLWSYTAPAGAKEVY